MENSNENDNKKSSEKKTSFGSIVLTAILIYAIFKFFPLGGIIGDYYYLKPLRNFLESYAENDYDKFISAFADFHVQEAEFSEEEMKQGIEKVNKIWNEKYGDDIKVNCSIKSKKEVDDVGIAELGALSFFTSISKKQFINIQKGYVAQVEIKIAGSKTSKSAYAEVVIAKINSKWVLLDFSGDMVEFFSEQ